MLFNRYIQLIEKIKKTIFKISLVFLAVIFWWLQGFVNNEIRDAAEEIFIDDIEEVIERMGYDKPDLNNNGR